MKEKSFKKPKMFFKSLIRKLQEDNVTAMGAQVSYYLILSIFPFIIFFLNILSYTPVARDDVLTNLVAILPADTQRIVFNLVSETINKSSDTLLSIGAITGVWAASKGLMALIRALNKAYDVEEKRNYFELRALAVLFTLALLVLLVIVLITLVFGEILGNRLFDFLGMTDNFIVFWQYFRILVSLAFMILVFALLYKFSPSIRNEQKISFKNTLPGAIFTSIGWIITSVLFSYYVNNFANYARTYGSLGGIIVLLIWLYISSIIIITGGEVNATIKSLRK